MLTEEDILDISRSSGLANLTGFSAQGHPSSKNVLVLSKENRRSWDNLILRLRQFYSDGGLRQREAFRVQEIYVRMPTVTEDLIHFFSKVLPFSRKTVHLDIKIDFCEDDALYTRLLDKSLGNLTTSIETVLWHVPYQDSAGALLLMIANLSELRVLRMHLPVTAPIIISHRDYPESFPELQDIGITVSAACGMRSLHYMSHWNLPSFRSFGLFGDTSTIDCGVLLQPNSAKIKELNFRCKSDNIHSMIGLCRSLEVLSIDFDMIDLTSLRHPNVRSIVVHNFGLYDIAKPESSSRMHSLIKTCVSRIDLPSLVEVTIRDLLWWQVRQHSQWLSDLLLMCNDLRLLDKKKCRHSIDSTVACICRYCTPRSRTH